MQADPLAALQTVAPAIAVDPVATALQTVAPALSTVAPTVAVDPLAGQAVTEIAQPTVAIDPLTGLAVQTVPAV